MVMPNEKTALVALNRFGFGARPGDLTKAGADPRGFLKAELHKPDVALINLYDAPDTELMGSTPSLQIALLDRERRRMERAQKQQAAAAAPGHAQMSPAAGMAASGGGGMAASGGGRIAASGGGISGAAMAGGPMMEGMGGSAHAAGAPPPGPMRDARGKTADVKAKPPVREEQRLFMAEAKAHFDKAIGADAGFVERLVHFWSNHFCVSARKDQLVRVAAGPFEREAIRPFVLGRFADMLQAVAKHPAMLLYLDNQVSVGPDSRAGKNRKRGLNENLAREILELHTLGVGAGYTQADVTNFARVLTGWTMAGREGRLGEPGTFVFNANAHEPGAEEVLGKSYADGGLGQGEAALNDIARHPATATHIATKLARHFVADVPPKSLVERLAKVFQKTDGNLGALAHVLVDSPESWAAPPAKMRTPVEFVLAARRALHPVPLDDAGPILGALNLLGQPLWQPPGPNGFPDVAGAWISAEGMKVRLDIAWQIARQVKDIGDPRATLEAVLGAGASSETRQAVGRAESRQQAVALLLMAPEFQRR